MTAEVQTILDPELVIPSEDYKYRLEFWNRLDKWTTRRDTYIGIETLVALGELLTSKPVVNGLPTYDIHRIAGRIMSRPALRADKPRNICRLHLVSGYSPFWGDPANVERLATDVSAVDASAELALATDARAWPRDFSNPGCTECATAPRQLLIGPDDEPSAAWRAWLDRGKWGLTDLEEHAPKLFAQVRFADGAWTHAGDALAGSIAPASLLHHLAVLNDHAARIWRDHVDTRMREQQLASFGVTASLDSPSTHKNKAAMAQRKFKVGAEDVVCEWHTKLSPAVGRVHFTVRGESVVVGTIVDHLAT